MRLAFDLSLYLVTDPALCRARGLAETVRAAVRGGVTLVQLRDKHATAEAFVAAGRALHALLSGSGVPLIVNDRIDLVEAIGAEGGHIGQGDGDVAAARARLGPGRILGLSIETPFQTGSVDAGLVDYVGAGPVHATAVKPDHAAPIGFDGLAAIVSASPVPAVAIGGLGPADVRPVLGAGAAGLAVVSAVCGQADPEAASRVLAHAIAEARR